MWNTSRKRKPRPLTFEVYSLGESTCVLTILQGKLAPKVEFSDGSTIWLPVSCAVPDWVSLTLSERQEVMAKFIRKAEDQVKDKKAVAAVKDAEFSKRWPAIFELVTCSVFDDGKPRATSALYIFGEGGEVKGNITDRQLNEVCWATGAGFFDFLDTLEARIVGGDGVWVKKKAWTPGKRS